MRWHTPKQKRAQTNRQRPGSWSAAVRIVGVAEQDVVVQHKEPATPSEIKNN
jgi:hypothetical protein